MNRVAIVVSLVAAIFLGSTATSMRDINYVTKRHIK